MNASSLVRRFICPDCGFVHSTWSPYCSSCYSKNGLKLSSSTTVERAAVPRVPEDSAQAPSPVAEAPGPRLVIARPAPEPELTDPAEELDDFEPSSTPGPVPITDIEESTFVRDSTGLPPLDHVLGGGLVEASIVLLAAPPGFGKTSLTLQMLVGLGHRCLYVTGEETTAQLAGTGRRIGARSPLLYVHAAYNLEEILAHAIRLGVKTMAIDSIQKMVCDDIKGEPGSPGQVKACSKRLVRFTKNTGIAAWIIGQVTSDGDIAGPKAVEHDVDVVLELEPGPGFEGNERILRCPSKNRFGPTGVAGRFELTGRGFTSIDMDGWNEKL